MLDLHEGYSWLDVLDNAAMAVGETKGVKNVAATTPRSGSVPVPNRVCGVDFSGAKDAGRRIWVAIGIVERGTLTIQECRPAMTLTGGSRERDGALGALRRFIRQQGPCVVGLDFPFGLPRQLVDEDTWDGFVRNFATRYGSAEALKRACIKKAGCEFKRSTDCDAETPWCPYNLRLYKQTYYGIASVLAPLVRGANACVLPMQRRVASIPWLVEVCPASTLKRLGLYAPYKGTRHETARKNIMRHLGASGVAVADEEMLGRVIANSRGDALDAVIAAFAASKALPDDDWLSCDRRASWGIEGYVYR